MPKQITDEEILESAIEVIIEQGYTGATTRQIAAAAGISELTLFRRFENKKKLVLAALQMEIDKFSADYIGYTGDLADDLTRIVQFYQGMLRKRGRLVPILLAEIPRQPELAEVLHGPMAIIATVSQVIKHYQAEGSLRAGPPLVLLAALLGPVIVIGTAGQLYGTFGTTWLLPREYVAHFLHGYGADSA